MIEDEVVELTVHEAFDILFRFQVNFNGNACKEIFGEVHEDHYWDKWINSKENALLFWNRLDRSNRNKIVRFVSSRYM